MFCKNFFNTRYPKEILWLHLEPLGQYYYVRLSIIRTTRFVFRSKNHFRRRERRLAVILQLDNAGVIGGLAARYASINEGAQ
jgi:hypothetical protein